MTSYPILVPRLENTPHIPVTGTSAKAKQVLEQKLKYLREKLQKFRDNRLALQNKDKEFHGYTVGQIVYMYHPRGSLLQTASKKIKCEFVGPLAIYKCVSPTSFCSCLWMDICIHFLLKKQGLNQDSYPLPEAMLATYQN